VDFDKKEGGPVPSALIKSCSSLATTLHCQTGTVAPTLNLMGAKETVDNVLEQTWSERQGYHSVNTWLILFLQNNNPHYRIFSVKLISSSSQCQM